jgi:hypothetical protein
MKSFKDALCSKRKQQEYTHQPICCRGDAVVQLDAASQVKLQGSLRVVHALFNVDISNSDH